MRRFVSGMRNFTQLGHVPVLGDEGSGSPQRKHRQAFTPLIEELLAMDDDERIDAALRD